MRTALTLLTAAVLLGGCGSSTNDPAATSPAAPVRETAPRSSAAVSVVATAKPHSLAVYRRAGAPSASLHLPNPNKEGAPLVLLVKRSAGAWLQVHLPVRPNGSTGWVRRSNVRLANDPYRILVDLRTHRITVWKANRVVVRAPIGVGRAVTPTPSGLYFITELLKQPNPRGPF